MQESNQLQYSLTESQIDNISECNIVIIIIMLHFVLATDIKKVDATQNTSLQQISIN